MRGAWGALFLHLSFTCGILSERANRAKLKRPRLSCGSANHLLIQVDLWSRLGYPLHASGSWVAPLRLSTPPETPAVWLSSRRRSGLESLPVEHAGDLTQFLCFGRVQTRATETPCWDRQSAQLRRQRSSGEELNQENFAWLTSPRIGGGHSGGSKRSVAGSGQIYANKSINGPLKNSGQVYRTPDQGLHALPSPLPPLSWAVATNREFNHTH